MQQKVLHLLPPPHWANAWSISPQMPRCVQVACRQSRQALQENGGGGAAAVPYLCCQSTRRPAPGLAAAARAQTCGWCPAGSSKRGRRGMWEVTVGSAWGAWGMRSCCAAPALAQMGAATRARPQAPRSTQVLHRRLPVYPGTRIPSCRSRAWLPAAPVPHLCHPAVADQVRLRLALQPLPVVKAQKDHLQCRWVGGHTATGIATGERSGGREGHRVGSVHRRSMQQNCKRSMWELSTGPVFPAMPLQPSAAVNQAPSCPGSESRG